MGVVALQTMGATVFTDARVCRLGSLENFLRRHPAGKHFVDLRHRYTSIIGDRDQLFSSLVYVRNSGCAKQMPNRVLHVLRVNRLVGFELLDAIGKPLGIVKRKTSLPKLWFKIRIEPNDLINAETLWAISPAAKPMLPLKNWNRIASGRSSHNSVAAVRADSYLPSPNAWVASSASWRTRRFSSSSFVLLGFSPCFSFTRFVSGFGSSSRACFFS